MSTGVPVHESRRGLELRMLGRVTYADGLTLQEELVEARRAGRVPDQLLLLEHPPVITTGVKRVAGASHILASPETLAAHAIEVFDTGRGGDVTYHGPGQVVGYPVLDLRPDRQDVHRYVRDLESVMIDVAAEFGIEAGRVPGLTGVWVDGDKLGAIGVRISRWITSHGFAFNVGTNLEHFNFIVPCGIRGRGVTSLERILGTPVEMAPVLEAFGRRFCAVFDRHL